MSKFLPYVRRLVRRFLLAMYWCYRNIFSGMNVQSWNVGLKTRLERGVIIRKGVELCTDVEVGDYSYISGPNTYVESARIGKFCSIARQVVIGVGDHDHRMVTTHPFYISPEFGGLVASKQQQDQKSPPIIGNDVWVGINSVILRGVTIGDGAVVAANSVVTKDVEPYTIVGGNPAKFIKRRFPEDVACKLQEICWWDWDDDLLKERVHLFSDLDKFIRDFG